MSDSDDDFRESLPVPTYNTASTCTAHLSSAVRAEPSLDIQLQVEKSFRHLHLNTTVITK